VYNENWGDRDQVARNDYERALEAYDQVRASAPNYVQMHHQVGTLYLKRAEYEQGQGRSPEAEKFLDMALERFQLYRKHDPVFFPNYVRIAQIYMARRQYDKVAETYKAYLDADECAMDTKLTANKTCATPSWPTRARSRRGAVAAPAP